MPVSHIEWYRSRGQVTNFWESGDPFDDDTTPVEYYAANGYGLYDVAGNVWEWVNDWYDMDYYQYCVDHGVVNDPAGPTGPLAFRVVRGGSWVYNSSFLRVANRYICNPDFSDYGNGFRCARDAP
ncbi:formylglycine-generating enzyme family protein [Thermodesulfobacteriota bacterium]